MVKNLVPVYLGIASDSLDFSAFLFICLYFHGLISNL